MEENLKNWLCYVKRSQEEIDEVGCPEDAFTPPVADTASFQQDARRADAEKTGSTVVKLHWVGPGRHQQRHLAKSGTRLR